jgi:hypothetical protein
VKYDPPPPEPKQLTLILSFFGETDRQRNQEPWFVALPGGAFECNGVCFDADSEIDFTNPTMGETVRRKAGSGVVCIDDQMTRTVLIYAKAGWKRILGHPSGWFQIKTAHGKVKSMNCWSECFIWSIWPKLFILGFTLSFWPIALFTLPVVFFLHYTIAVRVPT